MTPRSRTGRASTVTALVVVVLALLAFALLFALRPYHRHLDFGDAPGAGEGGVTLGIDGRSAAAVDSAGEGSRDDLALWAVTVGTNMMGYTPAFGGVVTYTLLEDGSISETLPGAMCVDESRHRLIVAGWVVLAAVVGMVAIVVVARRDT